VADVDAVLAKNRGESSRDEQVSVDDVWLDAGESVVRVAV